MVAYRIDTKLGKLPIQFKERGLWRDFDSLLPDDSHLSPQVIEHAATLTRSTPSRFPQSVFVLGQLNTKAKIEFWRMELYRLPPALLDNKPLRPYIHELLDAANNVHASLEKSCRAYALRLLSRGNRSAAGRDIDGFMEQMPADSIYWSALERSFHEILAELIAKTNREKIRTKWLKSILKALQASWESHRASISMTDAWAIRAVVLAEGPVQRRLNELSREIHELELDEEVT